jgi:glycosyltransferase involved in cell wall biosynthesis
MIRANFLWARKLRDYLRAMSPSAAYSTTILFVANFPANTGYAWDFIEGLYGGVATRLAPQNVRSFVAYPSIPSPPQTLRGTPAEPIVLDARLETLASLRQTLTFIRRERVRLVYLTDRPVCSWFYPVLRLAGVRAIIVHDHTSGARTVPRGIKRLAKWILARVPGLTADRVIAVSDFVARRQREVALVPAGRVTRVWNSVAVPPRTADGKRAARHALQFDENAPIIACTCRATHEKGVDHLLRAFDRLPPGPILVYAGNGPAFASLQALRESLPSRDRIRLLGYRADRDVLLEAADICVVPSVWEEAFGLAALEAMARGKPVVATAVGGIPEIIRPGVTGLLVRPADEPQLTDALASLLLDATAAVRMGQEARRDVEARFTPESQLSRLTELITTSLPLTGAGTIRATKRAEARYS